jgi:dethiobiotin synthetase
VNGIFVTGTDTGVGKTVVCGLLAGFLRGRGVRVVTQKWVQTGCSGEPEDLAAHWRLSGLSGPPAGERIADLCPYRFRLPASPRLAAAREGRIVEASVIEASLRRLAARHDLVVVEGTGGFLVPLAEGVQTGDLVARTGLPVLVVVGNRLGCVNLALLTVEAVRRRDVPLLGMVFNRTAEAAGTSAEVLSDNPRAVAETAGAPVLGELPFLPDVGRGAEAFAPIGEAFLSRWRPA